MISLCPLFKVTIISIGFILLFTVGLNKATNIYRLCTTNNPTSNNCRTVIRGDSQVECIQVVDSVDCALKLNQGIADFGVFTAEEALLASNFIDKSVQVVADIRHVEHVDEPFAFQAVVVVKNSYGGTIESLEGLNFCHPGFAPGQLWTDSVLKQFERSVVNRNNKTPCDEGLPVMENEVKALSSFFKTACRPGPWVQNDMFDNRLKMNYSNLCELCDSPKTCSYVSHETGSHRAALACLTHRGGDLAYVALRYVQEYFGLEKGFSPMANANEYNFLCPDGSIEALNTPSPCAWVRQPWSAVLARRDIATMLQPQLMEWLSGAETDNLGIKKVSVWKVALQRLMLENDHTIASVTSLLSNFVRQIGGETRQCRKSVRWCVSGLKEQSKCEWLRAAVQTHGLQPALECVLGSNNWECYEHVRAGLASLTTIDTEYGYITRTSYNLTPLAYLDVGLKYNYQILAVIKSSSSKSLRSWHNIRQKKACFPEFGGLGWMSVISTLIENRQLPKICPHAVAVSSFFGGACVPGAKDTEHVRGSGLVPARLCSACTTHNSSDACTTSPLSTFYGDHGALRCLNSNYGDIAFVDYRQLTGSNGELLVDIDPNAYQVLCRNGSLAQILGLNVDNDCALAHGISSEVVARGDRSEASDIELTELLLELDQWFGSTSPSKMDSVLHMYSEFNGSKDLLFKDRTRGLILPNDSGYAYVNSYKKLQEVNSICIKNRNDGVSLMSSIIVLIAVAISPFVL